MSRAPETIQAELLGLSPIGYTRSPDSVWGKQLLAAATEGSLIEQMGEALHGEIDPRKADYLLAEWEALFGPDPYGADISGFSVAQMQAYLYGRLINRGGQSVAYFTALAAALGFTISIEESVITQYDDAVYDEGVYIEYPAQFQWLVVQAAAAQAASELALEPIFQALKPAHTQVVFSYTG